jgi:hypothetical protein
MNIATLTPQQLRNAAALKENIDALQDQLNELLGGEVSAPGLAPQAPANGRRKKAGKRRKKVSAEGRANISAAAKARWAARRMGQKSAMAAAEPGPPVKRKRKMSAAHRRALSLAAKARYARARRAAKSGPP